MFAVALLDDRRAQPQFGSPQRRDQAGKATADRHQIEFELGVHYVVTPMSRSIGCAFSSLRRRPGPPLPWIPAFAGMTRQVGYITSSHPALSIGPAIRRREATCQRCGEPVM